VWILREKKVTEVVGWVGGEDLEWWNKWRMVERWWEIISGEWRIKWKWRGWKKWRVVGEVEKVESDRMSGSRGGKMGGEWGRVREVE